jgi:hypothetical protein
LFPSVCCQMYSIKADDFVQHPVIMMPNVANPPRYISIADPH